MEGARIVDHALRALITLSERGEMSVAELATALDLSRGAAGRVVASLHAGGALCRGASGRYSVGPSLIRLTADLLGHFATIAAPTTRALAAETGHTTLLCGIDGDSAKLLDQATIGAHGLGVEFTLGHTHHMSVGAAGLAILAHLPPARRDRIARDTRHLSADALATRLRRTVADGFAVSHGEPWPGMSVLAAPIVDEHIGVIGSLAVAAPAPTRHEAPIERHARWVVDAARVISRRTAQVTLPAAPPPEAGRG